MTDPDSTTRIAGESGATGSASDNGAWLLALPTPPMHIAWKLAEGVVLESEEQVLWDEYEKKFEAAESRHNEIGLVDIAAVMREGVHPPEMLVPGLLAVAVHHIVYGTKEAAKTWLLLIAAVGLIKTGKTVMWVDEEMGRATMAERLMLLGAEPEQVDDHFVYLEYAMLDTSTPNRALWAALLKERQPALVVVDSQTEVLAAADLNENSGTDVAKWHMAYFAPALALGAATAVIDHTGHDAAGRPVGSRHKGAQSKIELEVTKDKSFNRDTIGEISISPTKNTHSAAIPPSRAFGSVVTARGASSGWSQTLMLRLMPGMLSAAQMRTRCGNGFSIGCLGHRP